MSACLFAKKINFTQVKNQNPYLIGEIKYSFWFWDVYDAKLYAHKRKFSWSSPFYLSLKYLRDFDGKDIANETIKQIRQLFPKTTPSTLDLWEQKLIAIFPNKIFKNDQLIGYDNNQGQTYFFDKQGSSLGHIDSREFAKQFFSIWLSPKSQNPDLSKKLRGK